MKTELTDCTPDPHLDPLTGEPGSHPVATGLAAVAGGTLGMVAAGALAGPIGIVAATIGGAVIGGYAGTAVGEVVTVEEAYWREHHLRRKEAGSRNA